MFPSLREDAVSGAIQYYDGQVDDARLVATLARTAASLGAAMVTSARGVGLLRDAREVTGVRVRDPETGEEFEVPARTVVAATGVWSDDIAGMLAGGGGRGRPACGCAPARASTWWCRGSAITGEAGLILRTADLGAVRHPVGRALDHRHHRHRLAPRPRPTRRRRRRDIAYLLDQVNAVLDRPLSTADIEGVYAGLRPLLRGPAQPHSRDEQTSALSRDPRRRRADARADAGRRRQVHHLPGDGGRRHRPRGPPGRPAPARWPVPPSRTADLPLLGADGYHPLWTQPRRPGPPARHLGRRAGAPAGALRLAGLRRPGAVAPTRRCAAPLAGAPEYLAAEIAYAAAAEGALHLEDVLTRRTRISFETAHRGAAVAADAAAELMGDVLGWDAATRDREIDHYLARVAAERESQRMPDDLTADAARLGAPDVRASLTGSPGCLAPRGDPVPR